MRVSGVGARLWSWLDHQRGGSNAHDGRIMLSGLFFLLFQLALGVASFRPFGTGIDVLRVELTVVFALLLDPFEYAVKNAVKGRQWRFAAVLSAEREDHRT